MNDIVQEIIEWPIIVQGALGSGLFWLILFMGQKLSLILSDRMSKYSTNKRISRLRVESVKYKITLKGQQNRASYFGLLLYRAIGRITIGLIWLTLGLAFQSILPIFGLVGYIGALYHFFNAWQIFKPLNIDVDKEKRIDEIAEEISKLEENSNQIQSTADVSAD